MSSLTVNVIHEPEGLRLILDGRIDARTAYNFSDALSAVLSGNQGNIVFDCEKLAYISSAGLRVLLSMHKRNKLPVKLVNVCHEVRSILDLTGFSQIFDVSGGND
ncbi:MAG: STAS domain-containing protein [Synergistaceae bacterium]|nr:STAS domain-containing protein [Synergistaceae bacterium]